MHISPMPHSEHPRTDRLLLLRCTGLHDLDREQEASGCDWMGFRFMEMLVASSGMRMASDAIDEEERRDRLEKLLV
jgi:hypothetical protein